MDAVEYLKERLRMCKSIDCDDCPLSNGNNKSDFHTARDVEKHSPKGGKIRYVNPAESKELNNLKENMLLWHLGGEQNKKTTKRKSHPVGAGTAK